MAEALRIRRIYDMRRGNATDCSWICGAYPSLSPCTEVYPSNLSLACLLKRIDDINESRFQTCASDQKSIDVFLLRQFLAILLAH